MPIKHLAQCLACIKGSNNNNTTRKDVKVFSKSSDIKRHFRGLDASHMCLKIVMLGEDIHML